MESLFEYSVFPLVENLGTEGQRDHSSPSQIVEKPTTPSPIHGLPPEILGEIFLNCVSRQTSFLRPERSEVLLIICRVSRLWRDVTFSTPSLWASISVLYSGRHLKPSTALIHSWVKMSGEYPLSIEFLVDEPEYVPLPSESADVMDDVLRIVVPECKRWRHIRMDIPRVLPKTLTTFPEDHTPLLESCDIRLFTPGSSYDDRLSMEFPSQLLNIFNKSPRLCSLTWHGASVDTPTLPNSIWQNLTELNLEANLAISECLTILKRCTKLENCAFHNVNKLSTSAHPPLSPEVKVLRHNTLRALRIESGTAISHLLRALILPSLTCLSLSATAREGWNDNLAAIQVPELLQRSSSPLEELILEDIPIIETDLIRCLYSLPTLLVLNIGAEESRLTDNLIHALGGHKKVSSCPYLCPNLEVIRLSGNVASSDGTFADMLDARRRAASADPDITHLKSVHVDFTNGRHPVDLRRMKKMRDAGLNTLAFSR